MEDSLIRGSDHARINFLRRLRPRPAAVLPPAALYSPQNSFSPTSSMTKHSTVSGTPMRVKSLKR